MSVELCTEVRGRNIFQPRNTNIICNAYKLQQASARVKNFILHENYSPPRNSSPFFDALASKFFHAFMDVLFRFFALPSPGVLLVANPHDSMAVVLRAASNVPPAHPPRMCLGGHLVTIRVLDNPWGPT